MTDLSQNGWPVIFDDADLRSWNIPTSAGTMFLQLRPGPPGFLLCHYALWHADNVEPTFGKGDDFGWALRRIAGSTEWSNHASGTAVDLNSSMHPSGQRNTYTQRKSDRIRNRLEERYLNLIKWGGNFRTTPDEMHFELSGGRQEIRELVADLVPTKIGQRIIAANAKLGSWADLAT